ncbi:MAG: Tetratricopeptide 2 repeat protein [Verrucomicrobiales bacterium]|nr:Tetratricopeptide 2 repeat protein [Verrucomicrobiales bacterium]
MLTPTQMLTTKNWGSALVLFTTMLLSVTAFMGCQPPGPRALLQGERLIGEEKFTQAIEKLKIATQLLPQNAQAWNHLGLAYYGAGQTDDAIRSYQQAIALDRNLSVARFNLGLLYLEQNRNPEAISELTTYTALQPNSTEGWLHLATAQLRIRRFDDAEKTFVRVQKLEPKNPEMLDGLGVIQLQRKRPRDAFNYFEAALQQNPQFAPALLNEAIVLQQYLNNRPAALQKYEAYLALKPATPNLEAIQESAHRLDLELHPRPIVVNTNLVVVPRTNTQPVRAQTNVALLRSNAVTNVPPASTNLVTKIETPSTRVTNSVTSVPAPKPQKIEPIPFAPVPNAAATQAHTEPEIKPEVINIADEAPPATGRDVAEIKPKPQTALTNAPQATTIAPEVPIPLPPLIKPVYREPKPSLGQKLNPLKWFHSRDPKEAPPVAVLTAPATGKLTNQVEKSDSASDQKTEPVREPDPVSPRRYSFDKFEIPAPGDRAAAQASLTKGVTAQNDSQLGAALEAYQQAIRTDPSYFDAYYNLALVAYELRNLPLALSASERAIRINPNAPNARYNFALALEDSQFPFDAEDQLGQVLKLEPKNARAHFALANLAAETLRKPEMAREHFRKVLELEPNHPNASQIRYWLAAHP